MNTTSRKRAAIFACLAALAATAVTANAATAAPATWNIGGPIMVESGPFVVKVGTTPTANRTYTCTPNPPGPVWMDAQASYSGPYGYLSGLRFSGQCTDGNGIGASVTISNLSSYTLRGEVNAGAYSLTGMTSMGVNIHSVAGGFGAAGGSVPAYSVPWTNGTHPINNPSTGTFTNAPIAKVAGPPYAGQPITLTGTLSFRATGGYTLLTLN